MCAQPSKASVSNQRMERGFSRVFYIVSMTTKSAAGTLGPPAATRYCSTWLI